MQKQYVKSREYRCFMIRESVEDYVKFFQDKWSLYLKSSPEQHEIYMRTRARRSKGNSYKNNDLLPDFYSIERDADQFGLEHVEWTDFFGLTWVGKKGVHAYVGAPNYEGNIYYYDDNDECDEEGFCISYDYDAYDNQPPDDTYTRIWQRGIHHWIDTANVVDISYKYFVNNHLFKDTHIDLIYEDGQKLTVYSEYEELIKGLMKHGKEELVKKVFDSMNENFIKLRDSDREDERKFFPGKTAEEMFLGDEDSE